MNEEAVALALFVLQEAIKQAPGLVNEFQGLFNGNPPTDEEWTALRTKILSKSYKDYVPTTALPDDQSN